MMRWQSIKDGNDVTPLAQEPSAHIENKTCKRLFTITFS